VRDLVLVFMVTLRFIPLLALTIDRIAKAQASRGADWSSNSRNPLKIVRKVFPLLVPLFLQALQKAERMALALDSRGYSSLAPHTSMQEFLFKLSDIIAVLLSILLMAGLIAANYL
jgi:energy-coupling factor transport system permease protein